MLDCLAECDNASSTARRDAEAKYKHLQFPQDKALCGYECLGLMTTDVADDLVECIGTRGCMAPAEFSDECADISQDLVLPFSNIRALEGRWNKIFTNGWDIWPCQLTVFYAPGAAEPEPKAWMSSWPKDPKVWRMDLTWSFRRETSRMFTMSNEIYPNERWSYGGANTATDPTLKTLARMWGTTAHENWYVLYADENMLLVHVCAYTLQVQSFDALTIVLLRENTTLTDDMMNKIQQIARDILGDKFGKLLPIHHDCTLKS